MVRKQTLVLVSVIVLSVGVVAFTGTVSADEQEPNDDFETAQPISEGNTSGEIVDGESDFFEIQANTTDAVRVELENVADGGGLALRLYNSDQEEIVGDESDFGVPGPLTIKLPETGTYYVEVKGTNTQKTTEYTLDYDKITPPENDQFAPNSNFSTAASPSEGLNDAKIWGGETDFYKIQANTTDAIQVGVENVTDCCGGLALRLYNSDREKIVGSEPQFSEPGPLTKKLPETGTYYIEVEGTNTQKTTEYTLDSNRSNNDSDDDTIPDMFDEAPNQPEDFDGCEDEDGVPDDYICPLVNNPPQDLDGDGLYEDIDGDGLFDIFDVQGLFNNLDSDSAQLNPGLFNFNGNENPENLGIFDVQGLFNLLD